jgi:hypothetical protein
MGLTLFRDCINGDVFRFDLESNESNVGDVFNIISENFNSYAKVIEYGDFGNIMSSEGVVFIQQEDCPNPISLFQVPFEPEVIPGDAIQNFCVSTQYTTLNSNTGNYSVANELYDDYVYYTGQTGGFIYFNTDKSQWCLSNSLGGDCVLFGKSPCYTESYPDLYNGIVFSGACPTPTPSITSCEVIDFNAYFNCELSATTTPTPTITPTITKTPTVTPTPSMTGNLAISVGMSAYTYTYPSVSVSPTPSITPTNNIIISGNVIYNVLDKSFAFSGTRLLTECSTGVIYYAYQDLIFGGIPVVIGQTMRVVVNGQQRCFEYTSNITTVNSSNIYIDEILEVIANCSSCLITPTPTPTASITPTPTVTPTIESTPTPSSGMVYVFQSCLPIGLSANPTLIIQTQGYQTSLSINSVIKDVDDNCWSYLGVYSNTYIPPTNVNPITYTGNYFASYTSSSFVDCQACLAALNLS